MIKLFRRLLGKSDRKEAVKPVVDNSGIPSYVQPSVESGVKLPDPVSVVTQPVVNASSDESHEQQSAVVAYDPENGSTSEVVVAHDPENGSVSEVVVAHDPENGAIELAPVTVAPKFDKSSLETMKKGELEELAKKHGVDVKARAKKDELVDKLSQL